MPTAVRTGVKEVIGGRIRFVRVLLRFGDLLAPSWRYYEGRLRFMAEKINGYLFLSVMLKREVLEQWLLQLKEIFSASQRSSNIYRQWNNFRFRLEDMFRQRKCLLFARNRRRDSQEDGTKVEVATSGQDHRSTTSAQHAFELFQKWEIFSVCGFMK